MGNEADQELNTSAHEAARIQVLHSYAILHTPPELAYDQIVASIQRIFDVPIAFLSLVDDHHQWFKAKAGLEACETPREASFCNHTIVGDTPLLVPDTLLDDRFCNNPYVLHEPYVRFYVGAPLVTPHGYSVGTLCAADIVPRKVSQKQVSKLITASKLIVRFLEARKLLHESFRYGETLTRMNKDLGSASDYGQTGTIV